MMSKKLIEVAIPLDVINDASVREKSIRQGHPATLHLWWARRPLATARAILFASLVDDPSSNSETFPTEEDQNKERQRLFSLMGELIKWENIDNKDVIEKAKQEIQKYNNVPIDFLDPFSGGGAIPMEAQRLGLRANASDLNPVAVIINKAMLEYPYICYDRSPVNPNKTIGNNSFKGIVGLIEDIKYYSKKLMERAKDIVGKYYPSVRVDNGEYSVISWIWARTVKCSNPACNCNVPLAASYILSKNKSNYCHAIPHIDNGKITFEISNDPSKVCEPTKMSRGSKFKCPFCGEYVQDEYIRKEASNGRMGKQLIAIAAEGKNGRVYFSPDKYVDEEDSIGEFDYPDCKLEGKSAMSVPLYGMDSTSKLFTKRQLLTLTTFSNLIPEIQKVVTNDAIERGIAEGKALCDGGDGAIAYGEIIGVYLALLVDKLSDICNTLNAWEPIAQCPRHLFTRQAIPMVWDFAEGNPFGNSSGSWLVLVNNLINSLSSNLYAFKRDYKGIVKQADAAERKSYHNLMISTDPPYYNNIGYADLSDFFYVWLRNSLRNTYPELFGTILVPKKTELVATPLRFDGSVEKAKNFFEDGMLKTFQNIYEYTSDEIPLTIYYAYKQSESDENDGNKQVASSGWETMLSAIIKSGFSITGTWPVRTEMGSRSVARGTNALASSIVLVCRKREKKTGVCTRREFINLLRKELKTALKDLQQSNIAPVDLAQSSIGPGISVYSRYESILESDGSVMSVRSALQIINQELDAFISEQDINLDSGSRFCISLYTQSAYNNVKYGEADVLARAKNVSVEKLAEKGALQLEKGIVRLKTRDEIQVGGNFSLIWLLCQQLTKELETNGIEAAAKILKSCSSRDIENAKSLAYRLFTIADQKKWTQEAYAYNALITAWPDIQTALMMLIGPEEKPGVTRIDRWLQ